MPWRHLRAHTHPTMSGYRIPRVNANVPDAGSKRSREAIETQVVPAKSVRYESSPSICTSPMLHNAHAQPCYLHTRLQCDLSGPAKLDARTIYTSFRTTDSPYTDATPRVHDLSTHFLCVAPAVSTYAPHDTSIAIHRSRTQVDDGEPNRAVLVLRQSIEEGEERLPINDGSVLAALVAHCEDAGIMPSKPQYGFHSDSPKGPWKAYFDATIVEAILEAGDLIQVEFIHDKETHVASIRSRQN